MPDTHPNDDSFSLHQAELQEAGLKATLSRMRVLEIIRGSKHRHLSAEDIYHRITDLGFKVGVATVYRALSQLEEAGLLSRNVFDGGKAVYEINEGNHHNHLICLDCGRVDEFSSEAIEALQCEIADALGYERANHRLVLHGHCAACVAARTNPAQRVK